MWIDLESLSKQQKRKIEYILKEKEVSRIKVKLLNKNCMPERTHRWDAGWDLKASETVTIQPGCTEKIHTGVIFEIPPRNCGMVVPRSSLGTKFRVTLANDVGIIDSEYRGEILVFLANDGDDPYKVNSGDRFAQIVIVPVNIAELWPVDSVSNTGRGDGGFGSTTAALVEEVNENPDSTMVFKENFIVTKEMTVFPEQLTDQGETITDPIEDLTDQGETITDPIEDTPVEELRLQAIENLKKLTPVEYIKLKTSGVLYTKYPMSTGDMQVDLGL